MRSWKEHMESKLPSSSSQSSSSLSFMVAGPSTSRDGGMKMTTWNWSLSKGESAFVSLSWVFAGVGICFWKEDRRTQLFSDLPPRATSLPYVMCSQSGMIGEAVGCYLYDTQTRQSERWKQSAHIMNDVWIAACSYHSSLEAPPLQLVAAVGTLKGYSSTTGSAC